METKKEFKYFTIFNHEEEENYLRKQHKAGWKFARVTGLGMYHFEKCEPEDVVYQLDYNQEGLAHKEEYIQMFVDCGWEYLQEYVGYSYFRKSAKDMNREEEIFNDSGSKVAMMERVIKGRLLPLLVLFCVCIIPQFIHNMQMDHLGGAAMWGAILIIYSTLFAVYAKKYHQLKNRK